MASQVEAERKRTANRAKGTGNLVSNLIRTSDDSLCMSKNQGGGNRLKLLTNAEIMDNISVFNFAGHDTTAISLAYGILLLVAFPRVQDWIHEEIVYYVEDQEIKKLSYNELFPKLKRSLAVLVWIFRGNSGAQ